MSLTTLAGVFVSRCAVRCSWPAVALLLLAPAWMHGAAVTWTGDGDQNWSSPANWSDTVNGIQTDDDATFGSAGWSSSGDTSVCNADIRLNALRFDYNSTANRHQLSIPEGVTLTISNAVSSADSLAVLASGDNQHTRAHVVGDGTLDVRDGHLRVGNWFSGWTVEPDRARLNLAGLREFRASVGSFRVGADVSKSGGGTGHRGLMELAATNTIVTPRMDVGTTFDHGDGGSVGTLRLGETNSIRSSLIYVGHTKGVGTINFRTGLSQPTVTIRGTDGGTTRATLIAGLSGGSSGANSAGTLDFTGGVVDAMLGTVTLGQGGGGERSATGLIKLDAGTIDATSMTLGRNAGSSSFGTGSLTIAGTGLVKVGTLTMGDRVGSGPVTATLNLEGGRLEAGAIAVGAGTAARSIAFAGGTLATIAASPVTIPVTIPITLSTAAGHTFEVANGDTMTVNAAIGETGSPVGGLVKTGGGALTLAADNTFTGGIVVSNGTVTLNGSLPNADIRVESGATLTGTGALVFNINGETSDAGLVAAGGTVDVSGFSLTFAGAAPTLESYIVVTNDNGTLTGTFAATNNIPGGFELVSDGTSIRLDRLPLVETVITVIPEETYETGNSLTVSWTTDETVAGWLAYRVDGSSEDYTLTPATEDGTSHSVTVGGLVELTDYDVVIWSSASSLAYPMTTLIADPATVDTTWTGTAADDAADWRWRRGGNWNVGQPPGTNSLATFTDGGLTYRNGDDDTAWVDVATTNAGLAFAYNSSTHAHQIRIADDARLVADRASGNVLSIAQSSSNHRTRARFVGGTLVLGVGGTASINVSNYGTTGNASSTESEADRARLDLSDLAVFEADVSRFDIGRGVTGQPNGYRGLVILAATNRITAGTLTVAETTADGGNFGVLRLGRTNDLRVGTLNVGAGKAKGWLYFSETDGGSAVRIRGTAGDTSSATLNVGRAVGNSGWNYGGIIDFSGGYVDARFATATLGGSSAGLSGTGLLTLDAGILDATTIVLAHNSAGAGAATGTLTVNGTAHVRADTITLAIRSGTGACTATLNLNAGVLEADTIQPGAGTGTRLLNWTGGALSVSNCTLSAVTQDGATAILSPGLSGIATNSFGGDLTVANGQWDIDVDGLTSDQVQVTGELDLQNVVLNVRAPNGLTRPVIIATYGTRVGAFSAVTGVGVVDVDYAYQNDNQIALIPPPRGTLMLFR